MSTKKWCSRAVAGARLTREWTSDAEVTMETLEQPADGASAANVSCLRSGLRRVLGETWWFCGIVAEVTHPEDAEDSGTAVEVPHEVWPTSISSTFGRLVDILEVGEDSPNSADAAPPSVGALVVPL